MAAGTTVDTLLDILELVERIRHQTAGLDREVFIANHDVLYATAYRLLAIGESARAVDDELRSRHAHVPWRDIVAMRNFLAHEYFLRESEIIWETVQTGLPDLADACRTESARLGWTD